MKSIMDNLKKPSILKGNITFMVFMIIGLFTLNILRFLLIDLVNIQSFTRNESYIYAIQLATNQIVILGGVVLIYFLVTREKFKDVIPIRKIKGADIFYIFLITVVTRPIIGVISMITSYFTVDTPMAEAVSILSKMPFLAMFLVVAILPAIFEEFFMRGIVANNFKRYSLFAAALFNGVLFGIFHMNFEQGFFPILLGFLAIYLMYYTQSIVAPMLLHFFNNGTSVILTYLLTLLPGELSNTEVDTSSMLVSQNQNVAYYILLGILAIGVVVLFGWLTYLLVNLIKERNEERWMESNDYKKLDGKRISFTKKIVDYIPFIITLIIYFYNVKDQIRF
ncbi:putative membrane protein [Clostridium bornimense]|uniref:Putative membrane protein n=1 Tax=Clostridium bornimense TaxID=1216932 RepID=W6SDF7_9CLOT|nr:type II CAAX endopeptidase family protein [Clostridium bornimense]CDM67680.1 putative membrane protein [Clostridium bornimense]